MSDLTITLTLPEALYARARETAQAAALSIEDVLTQSIALSLPPLEDDLPADLRADLAALPLLSVAELQGVAASYLETSRQTQLQDLAETSKHNPLNPAEQHQLAELMRAAEYLMLRKAEAQRLLAGRGHSTFTHPATS